MRKIVFQEIYYEMHLTFTVRPLRRPMIKCTKFMRETHTHSHLLIRPSDSGRYAILRSVIVRWASGTPGHPPCGCHWPKNPDIKTGSLFFISYQNWYHVKLLGTTEFSQDNAFFSADFECSHQPQNNNGFFSIGLTQISGIRLLMNTNTIISNSNRH